MKRREFVKGSVVISSSLCFPVLLTSNDGSGNFPVVKVQGESPDAITKKALGMLGGMEKFVSKQDIVMIKPNISWNRTVEQAATTNPEVVKAIVEMVFNAGAKKVIIMDHPLHKAEKKWAQRYAIPMTTDWWFMILRENGSSDGQFLKIFWRWINLSMFPF